MVTPDPVAARWSWYIHVFISISLLRTSSDADTHRSSAVFPTYLIRIFYPACELLPHSLWPLSLSSNPSLLPFFCSYGWKVCCLHAGRCCEESVFKSLLLTDSLDLLSSRRPRSQLGEKQQLCWFLFFILSSNTTSFAVSSLSDLQLLKVASRFSLILSVMLKPSLRFLKHQNSSEREERRHLRAAGKMRVCHRVHSD